PNGLKTQPAGSGPYKLAGQPSADLTYTFDLNPNYWDKSHVFPAHVQIISNLQDENARLNAIRSGVIDLLNISALNYYPAKNDSHTRGVEGRGYKRYGSYQNNKPAPRNRVGGRGPNNTATTGAANTPPKNDLCPPLAQALPRGVIGYDKKLDVKMDIAAAKKM